FIPPTWEVRMAGEELREKTNKGRFIPMAFEYETSKLETVSSAVAVGIPEDDHAGIFMEYSEKGMGAKELEERAIKSVREVFSFRNWRAKEIISKSVEERPKRNTYACSLVAILFFPEISEK
ncbi:MAG: pyruvoyl-dependent arginine decarboxylase, partial [archaeon]